MPVLGCTPMFYFRLLNCSSWPPQKTQSYVWTVYSLVTQDIFGNSRCLQGSSSIDGQFSMAASITRGHLDLWTVCSTNEPQAFVSNMNSIVTSPGKRNNDKNPMFFFSPSDRGFSEWVMDITRGLIRWIPKVLKSTKSDMVFSEDMDVGQNGRPRGPQIEMSSYLV